MKKVGIITLHFSINYGAVLQCLALTETVKKMNFDVEVINYYPQYAKYYWEPRKRICDALHDVFRKIKRLKNNLLYECLRSIKYVVSFNLNNQRYKSKYNKFVDFSNRYLPLSEECSNIDKLDSSRYDILITGSDQVWNADYTDFRFDPAYFLDFGPDNITRVAYGVSMHLYDDEVGWRELSAAAHRIDAVSVREESAQKIMLDSGFFGNCLNVLDPTLLLTLDAWEKFENKGISLRDKYVLIYSLNGNDKCRVLADAIAKTINAKIIDVSPVKVTGNAKWIYDCDPSDFLFYVHHADYVVTDSFHGTVFSIIFSRRFVSIPGKKKDSRIRNLLKILELESCLYNSNSWKLNCSINYNNVEKKIKEQMNESIDFLALALK